MTLLKPISYSDPFQYVVSLFQNKKVTEFLTRGGAFGFGFSSRNITSRHRAPVFSSGAIRSIPAVIKVTAGLGLIYHFSDAYLGRLKIETTSKEDRIHLDSGDSTGHACYHHFTSTG
jgi:hypothetical protein